MKLTTLIPAALLMLYPSLRTATAQTYQAIVESRTASTTITAPGFSLFAEWEPGIAPPVTRASADGNITHWNGEGYTGLTDWPSLVSQARRRPMLIGRTLQGSASGQGNAMYIQIGEHRYTGTVTIGDGDWFDRYACEVTITVTDWPWHRGDADRDGTRSVGDLWYYTAVYTAGHWQADFDGDDAITTQDLFDFLAAYFGP